MNEAQVRETLRDYICCELIRDENYSLGDNEQVITSGLIDSFALAELAVYVEKKLNVYIPDPDLTVAKMNTLNQMVARVMRDIK